MDADLWIYVRIRGSHPLASLGRLQSPTTAFCIGIYPTEVAHVIDVERITHV